MASRASTATRRFDRPGRLIPRPIGGLKARSVVLADGGVMDWHSTHEREELILVLQGPVKIQIQGAKGAKRSLLLAAGKSFFLPAQTVHRVVNAARKPSRYVYVTGPSAGNNRA